MAGGNTSKAWPRRQRGQQVAARRVNRRGNVATLRIGNWSKNITRSMRTIGFKRSHERMYASVASVGNPPHIKWGSDHIHQIIVYSNLCTYNIGSSEYICMLMFNEYYLMEWSQASHGSPAPLARRLYNIPDDIATSKERKTIPHIPPVLNCRGKVNNLCYLSVDPKQLLFIAMPCTLCNTL